MWTINRKEDTMDQVRCLVLFVALFFTADLAHTQTTATTGRTNVFTWIPQVVPHGETSVTFDVQASQDVHVTLTQTPGAPGQFRPHPGSYNIFLGGFANAKSCMNEAHAICRAEHAERGVLHGGQLRSFWIKWTNGLVQVGKGCNPGRYWMMEYQFPQIHEVRYIGIKTTASGGIWRYGHNGCSGNYGTGGPSLPDQAVGQMFSTPDSGGYKKIMVHLDPSKHTMIKFDVKASNDVSLVLGGNINNMFENAYYITIGANRNSINCVHRSGGRHCELNYLIRNILNSQAMNSFWISFKDGIVEVGKGTEYDHYWRIRMMKFEDPKPIKVKAIGIRTMHGSSGEWIIRSVTQVPVLTETCPPAIPTPSGCPDREAGLRETNFGNSPHMDVIIDSAKYLLTASSTVNTLIIRNNGKLVLKDDPNNKIILRTRHIIIEDGGEFHIGSEECPYQGQAEIQLVGRTTDDKRYELGDKYGRKVIGVGKGGTLEIHGQKKLSWTQITKTLKAGSVNPKIYLADDVSSWKPGDKIVIATTDFEMKQTEEFELDHCKDCDRKSLKIKGTVRFDHFGEIYKGVDLRAEVGLLTRNIVIRGVIERGCYGEQMTPNYCRFFSHDTFGGHMIFHKGFRNVHLSGVEVTNMGQQVKARYPIHFHLCDDVDEVGCYTRPAYVKDVSIHHCFDRCITIHGTDGLLVKDTVGYDTLGHCYFFEDGGEQRNILDHNLGVNTGFGTVEPSDRSHVMCREIRNWVWPGYIPDVGSCNAVSTFWISHPNNTLINNAAIGSKGTGYWYIFRDAPSGPSEGKLPTGHISHSTFARFHNNKALGHVRAGLMVDFGVKTGPSTASDRSETLSMGAGHFKPKTTGIMTGFTAAKCDQGAWLRGGAIEMFDCRYADNIIGHTYASAGEMTVDGEYQAISRTVFVGRSPNSGTNAYFKRRTIKGFRIYDGPISIKQSTFTDFIPSSDPGDRTHAIAFFGGPFQMSPKSQVIQLDFLDKSVRIKASRNIERDAEKTEILWDRDGSLTGYRNSYYINNKNYINRHEDCLHEPMWEGLACGGKHASLYVRRSNPNDIGTILVRDEFWNQPMMLKGFGNVMHTVMLGSAYTLHWQGPSPQEVILKMVNFDLNDWLTVGVCFGAGGNFDVYYETEYQRNSARKMTRVYSLEEVQNGDGTQYFWDDGARLLFVKPKAKLERNGWWYYPEGFGTEQIRIKSHTPGGHGDCRSTAYPKYARQPKSIALIPGGCTVNCGAPI